MQPCVTCMFFWTSEARIPSPLWCSLLSERLWLAGYCLHCDHQGPGTDGAFDTLFEMPPQLGKDSAVSQDPLGCHIMELLELWAPVDQRTLVFWLGCRGPLQGEARSLQAGLVVWKLEKGSGAWVSVQMGELTTAPLLSTQVLHRPGPLWIEDGLID